MTIRFATDQHFQASALQALFLSVGWSSGQYPQSLQVAMQNSHSVVSAWHGQRLVGLMNALSDGAMTAYFHYLLCIRTISTRVLVANWWRRCGNAIKHVPAKF